MKFNTFDTPNKQAMTRNYLQAFDLEFEDLPISTSNYSKLKRLVRKHRTKRYRLDQIDARINQIKQITAHQ